VFNCSKIFSNRLHDQILPENCEKVYMLYYTCVKLVARGPNVARHVFLCGLRSLNFKPQPAYFFGTVVVYTCL